MEITEFTDETERTLARLDRIMSRTFNRAGLGIMQRAQNLVPKDTGWAANSIYIHEEGKEHGGRPALPQGHRPEDLAEYVAPEVATEGGAVEVRVAANYGVYLEEGTVHMAARPFLGPAADEVFEMIDKIALEEAKREGL